MKAHSKICMVALMAEPVLIYCYSVNAYSYKADRSYSCQVLVQYLLSS